MNKIFEEMRKNGEVKREYKKMTVIRYEPGPLDGMEIFKIAQNSRKSIAKRQVKEEKDDKITVVMCTTDKIKVKKVTDEEFEVITYLLGNPGETKPGSRKYIYFISNNFNRGWKKLDKSIESTS